MDDARDGDGNGDHVPGILHGDAGYGLACLHLWRRTNESRYLQEARRVGDHLRRSHLRTNSGAYWLEGDDIPIGYAHGASGVSVFLLSLARATKDNQMAQLSRDALQFDLETAVRENRTLSGFPALLNTEFEAQSPVLYSYWDQGTAGIGSALVAHLSHCPDTDLTAFLDQMTQEATRKYTAFPQLFSGGAGLGNFLLDAFDHTGDEALLSRAWHVAEGVLLCKIERDEGVVFPGEQARRESADFATGSAGICLFLDRLLKAKDRPSGNFNFMC